MALLSAEFSPSPMAGGGRKTLSWGVLTTPEFETRMYFKNSNGGDGRRRRQCVVQAIDVFRNSADFVMVFLWDGVNDAVAVLSRRLEIICDWKGLQKGSIIEIKRYGFNANGTIVLEDVDILQLRSPMLFHDNPDQNFGDDTVVHVSSADLLPQRQPARSCNHYSCYACTKPSNIYQSLHFDPGYPSFDPYDRRRTAVAPCSSHKPDLALGNGQSIWGALGNQQRICCTLGNDQSMWGGLPPMCDSYSGNWGQIPNRTNQEIYPRDTAKKDATADSFASGDLKDMGHLATEVASLSATYKILQSKHKELKQNYQDIEDKAQMLQKEWDDSLGYLLRS